LNYKLDLITVSNKSYLNGKQYVNRQYDYEAGFWDSTHKPMLCYIRLGYLERESE